MVIHENMFLTGFRVEALFFYCLNWYNNQIEEY